MLTITYTTSFKRDYKRAVKQRKNIKKLDDILYQLSHQIPLNPKCRDHKLSGDHINKRDCHIAPDWLLIYEIKNEDLILYRVGSHSELFNK